jgi:hypothetical protein
MHLRDGASLRQDGLIPGGVESTASIPADIPDENHNIAANPIVAHAVKGRQLAALCGTLDRACSSLLRAGDVTRA